jgi:hypothetical protein
LPPGKPPKKQNPVNNLSLNLLTLPLWWYTTGWKLLWSWNKHQINIGLHETGITFFIHHLREPLYGDYTRSGIMLGLFFRVILLVIKSILLLVRLVILTAVDLLFLAALPMVLAMIIYQLTPN